MFYVAIDLRMTLENTKKYENKRRHLECEPLSLYVETQWTCSDSLVYGIATQFCFMVP
jgi:hypothetical protein